jgi:hypothetical protein
MLPKRFTCASFERAGLGVGSLLLTHGRGAGRFALPIKPSRCLRRTDGICPLDRRKHHVRPFYRPLDLRWHLKLVGVIHILNVSAHPHEAFDGPEWTFELKYDGFCATRTRRAVGMIGAMVTDLIAVGALVLLLLLVALWFLAIAGFDPNR